MIHILKKGKLPYKATCDTCGCIFEYTRIDVFVKPTFTHNAWFVTCPYCGYGLNLPNSLFESSTTEKKEQ